MKTVVLISTGSFIHLEPYVDFYIKKGFEVCLLAITPLEKEINGVRVFELSQVNSRGNWWKKFFYLTSIVKARRIIKEFKPDFVHAHFATSGGVTAWLSSGKVPYIITAHGSDVLTHKKSRIWRFLFKRIFKKANLVNAVSNEIEEFIQSLGIANEKIVTASVGVDVELFKTETKRDWSKLKLICTRAFEPVYNQKLIIEALNLLSREAIEFQMLFVGEGTTRQECEEIVAQYELDERISFMDRQPNGVLPDILAKYNYYISASLSDGTSVCLLEAMASGLIPIVSDIRSNRDWVVNGINGYLFALDNPGDLLNQIFNLINFDSDFFYETQRNNLLKIRSEADREEEFEKFLQAYLNNKH